MGKISASLSKLGFTIRGMYGEGNDPKGSVYQLSNQVTLGISEAEAIDNLRDITMQLIAQERAAREAMAENITILDGLYRSFGILRYAKILTNDECWKLLSDLRFGVEIGIFENIDYDTINRLMIEVQPATLMKNIGKKLPALERERIRAELIRTAIARPKVPASRRLE